MLTLWLVRCPLLLRLFLHQKIYSVRFASHLNENYTVKLILSHSDDIEGISPHSVNFKLKITITLKLCGILP